MDQAEACVSDGDGQGEMAWHPTTTCSPSTISILNILQKEVSSYGLIIYVLSNGVFIRHIMGALVSMVQTREMNITNDDRSHTSLQGERT